MDMDDVIRIYTYSEQTGREMEKSPETRKTTGLRQSCHLGDLNEIVLTEVLFSGEALDL